MAFVVNALIVALILISLQAIAPASPSSQPSVSPAASPEPDPKLAPSDVVRIVVEALGKNNAHDDGIRTTWKFASPANQSVTGPLERFLPMVKSPAFAPLLNFVHAKYSAAQVKDDQAMEMVVLTDHNGDRAAYLFQLSRQSDGKLKGCWMTDGVIPVQPRPEPANSDLPI